MHPNHRRTRTSDIHKHKQDLWSELVENDRKQGNKGNFKEKGITWANLEDVPNSSAFATKATNHKRGLSSSSSSTDNSLSSASSGMSL
ncbi:MAG: hypothetical protein MK137_04500 [Rickettsiales bacterium]|nr:hypothetical protein [Rickettsiales bacterium]